MAERSLHPMPKDVQAVLDRERLEKQCNGRPPYQRNDYVGWITSAKCPETRTKRIEQMIDELKCGDLYMKMAKRAE